jgi:ribosome-associated protein
MVRHIPFELSELDYTIKAVRSRGPGGQHVNKSSTAVQLFFNVRDSSLSAELKARMLARYERRLSADGCIVLKAQGERSRELNRRAVLLRLQVLIEKAAEVSDARKPTRPTRASRERRLKQKNARAAVKKMRSAAIRDAE